MFLQNNYLYFISINLLRTLRGLQISNWYEKVYGMGVHLRKCQAEDMNDTHVSGSESDEDSVTSLENNELIATGAPIRTPEPIEREEDLSRPTSSAPCTQQ